jgi:hypothetical protein
MYLNKTFVVRKTQTLSGVMSQLIKTIDTSFVDSITNIKVFLWISCGFMQSCSNVKVLGNDLLAKNNHIIFL